MEYLLHILVITGIYIILTLSLNLILGYTGLPAFGHAAFSCVGAYTSSLLALQYGISPWVGLTLGACVAAVLGLLIGLPSIRLKGDYLALATFGFGVIVYSVAKNWVSLTKGPLSGGSKKKGLSGDIARRFREEIANETDDFLFPCQPSHKRRNGLPFFPFIL